jgi:thiol-disulfide isomerase/thioredoxin
MVSVPMAPGPSRTADRLLWGLVVVAAAAVVAVAIARGRARPGPGAGASPPNLSLPLLDGKGHASIEKGRVTMVDFWATWCAPCRVSMPRIQEVWREYSPRGVDLYSVDTDDPGADREAQVKGFLLSNGLTFPVVLDDGTASSAFSIAVLPTMVVLDRDAHVVWQHSGALTTSGEKELRGVLDRALAAPAASRGGG